MTRRKPYVHEAAMSDDELSRRMGSTAGRRLQARLAEHGLLDAPHAAEGGAEPSTEPV